jgi:hypothetical protein
MSVTTSVQSFQAEDLARERRLVIITGPGTGSARTQGGRYSMDECASAATDVLASLGVAEQT